ncbi:MAG: hypothetical protein Tsb0013_19120 [Phycisphaerales bacterium]
MSAERTVLGIADEAWGVYARVCVTLGDRSEAWAGVVHQNVLDDGAWAPEDEEPAPGGRLIVWSGSLGEGLFERSPETWLPTGMERLRAWLDRAARARGVQLLLRPHARHVLCDAHRTAGFLAERPDLGLALAPVALLESDMLHDAEDHIVRTLETLGGRASCVVLQNIRPPETASGAPRRTPLADGMLDPERLIDLTLRYTPEQTPLVVMGTPEQHRAQAGLIASRA